jgi:hypothetical protein
MGQPNTYIEYSRPAFIYTLRYFIQRKQNPEKSVI